MNEKEVIGKVVEYAIIRMKMYVEKEKSRAWKKGEEKQMYSDLMELCSLIDYCYIPLGIYGHQLVYEVKQIHRRKEEMKKL